MLTVMYYSLAPDLSFAQHDTKRYRSDGGLFDQERHQLPPLSCWNGPAGKEGERMGNNQVASSLGFCIDKKNQRRKPTSMWIKKRRLFTRRVRRLHASSLVDNLFRLPVAGGAVLLDGGYFAGRVRYHR